MPPQREPAHNRGVSRASAPWFDSKITHRHILRPLLLLAGCPPERHALSDASRYNARNRAALGHTASCELAQQVRISVSDLARQRTPEVPQNLPSTTLSLQSFIVTGSPQVARRKVLVGAGAGAGASLNVQSDLFLQLCRPLIPYCTCRTKNSAENGMEATVQNRYSAASHTQTHANQ
jgi:hypothetical protein